MKTRKKWLRKTTAICTAALLGTAVIPSTAFAADDYASIEKNAWAAAVKNMASSYAASERYISENRRFRSLSSWICCTI